MCPNPLRPHKPHRPQPLPLSTLGSGFRVLKVFGGFQCVPKPPLPSPPSPPPPPSAAEVSRQPDGGLACGHTEYINKATVATILAANQALCFAKANLDAKLLYAPLLDSPEDIVFLAYSDAAFASPADLSSQGGYMVCLTLTHRAILDGGISSYHLLDWRSFRLPRVARSTLAAEGQAAAEPADRYHVLEGASRSGLQDQWRGTLLPYVGRTKAYS